MGWFGDGAKVPTHKSVLLVEDEDENRELAMRLLGGIGIEVILAKTGAEAVQLAKARIPTLILMDIVMPIMDGLQALAMIRAHPNTKDIPVIIISSRQRESEIKRAYELGAAGYIEKPYNVDVFVANVKAQLGLPSD